MSKSTSSSKFVICVRTDDSEDLETRKVYEVLPDPKGARAGYLRIIDESGEDYLYPAECFAAVKLPAATVREFVTVLSPAREPAPARSLTYLELPELTQRPARQSAGNPRP